MPGTALILGPSGRFATHTGRALAAAGWTLRRFDRRRDSIDAAARGVELIVNGWNPPYARWGAELPEMVERVIEAVRISGGTLIQPANVYVYGAGAPELLTEETPHAARNPLGRLRIEMEARLRAAEIPVILLRAGDFLDPLRGGDWISGIITRQIGRGYISYPGALDAPHAWAYLPDLGPSPPRWPGCRDWRASRRCPFPASP